MNLTAPIHVLKGKAKTLKRTQGISLSEALDRVARAEGFQSWGLLQSKAKEGIPDTKEALLNSLHPGDMLLIGARPLLGKTTLALQLLLEAVRQDRLCFFFSLEYSEKAFADKLAALGYEAGGGLLRPDFSDEISADYIIAKTQDHVTEGSVIAVDYLQLLDQKRSKPPLQMQIEALKAFAREKRCVFIFVSQIDRAFERDGGARPGLQDVRLPNPLDMGLFNKSVFLENGRAFA